MRQFLLFAPFLAANLFAQQQLASPADAVTENIPAATAKASEHAHETKRIFWIVPNFRTAPTLAQYQPLETKEKFHIATEDSLGPSPLPAFSVDSECSPTPTLRSDTAQPDMRAISVPHTATSLLA